MANNKLNLMREICLTSCQQLSGGQDWDLGKFSVGLCPSGKKARLRSHLIQGPMIDSYIQLDWDKKLALRLCLFSKTPSLFSSVYACTLQYRIPPDVPS